MGTRRYVAASDREQVAALLGSEHAVDNPEHRIHVAESTSGGLEGASLWYPTRENNGELVIKMGSGAPRASLYELALAACESALAEGYATGTFEIDARLASLLARDFQIALEPYTWNARTGAVTHYAVAVDLAGARQQLRARAGR